MYPCLSYQPEPVIVWSIISLLKSYQHGRRLACTTTDIELPVREVLGEMLPMSTMAALGGPSYSI